MSVVGARPQFVKCAAISNLVRQRVREVLVHTGQHYDENMSDVFFRELGIPVPDHNLAVGSGTHGAQTAEMLRQIEVLLVAERPSAMLVYGDTNSTLAAALAAAKLNIPVVHIEAGLRSFNRRMPEELNRVLTDHVSTLLFCPSETARTNLEREGITKGVSIVGDVMEDALLLGLERASGRSDFLAQNGLERGRYFLATVHRAENTEDTQAFKAIMTALAKIADSGMPVVFPVHPRSRRLLEASPLLEGSNVRLLEPLSFLDMVMATSRAKAVLTDSGGLQKEAIWQGIPCVTLREETEWVETVDSGWNVLAGARTDDIVAAAFRTPPTSFPHKPRAGAAQRMVDELSYYLGLA